MTQVISLVTPSQAMTPAHSPMDSDDYDRPRAFRALPDTPDSPSPRTDGLGRKRAAPINTSDASYGRLERLKLRTPSSMASNEATRDICLCTPAPKIPRPRNAFILYRQHYQAQVVARNPNLSNPDISKIIGEQWKDEPQEVKDNWKALADEEKQRHQQQYPDYRYQPRRGNKSQGLRSGSVSADESGRCLKCNLRCIATPSTPSTPYPPTPSASEGRAPPYPYTPALRDPEATRRASFGNLAMRQQQPSKRSPYQEGEEYGPESPEMKRRRYNTAVGYHPISSPGTMGRALSLGAASQRPYPVTPLPEPYFTRSKSGPMPPPPRPATGGPWPGQGHRGRHPSYDDESLRLPPLQTQTAMSPTNAQEVDIRQLQTPVTGLGISNARDPQARSVEAMVMSIPFTRKLSVLSKINHTPISSLGSGTLSLEKVENRGAVIAVEGPKPRILKQVGLLVERALSSSNEIALKTWGQMTEDDAKSNHSDTQDNDEPSDSNPNLASCFETMIQWHHKSREMVKHITSQTESLRGSQQERDSDSPISQRGSVEEDNAFRSSRDDNGSSKIPVALVKEGFSLTLSDSFACTIPIADAYAPIDHWQWMATLWRGTINPDLVIYVKPSLEDEIAKCGTVDSFKGLMVVRVAVGKDLDDATERRIVFEVIEWVRGGSFREKVDKGR